MKFSELDLEESVLDALDAMNFRECTPVQEHTIPVILEGRDLIGVAQTGTGKTALAYSSARFPARTTRRSVRSLNGRALRSLRKFHSDKDSAVPSPARCACVRASRSVLR